MITTLCLVACVLAPEQMPAESEWLLTPRLTRGQELVYRGTVKEETGGRGVRLTRDYRLETRIFVLDTSPEGAEVALFTVLKHQSAPAEREAPSAASRSVRLEIARVNRQGRVVAASGESLCVPLRGPATVERGALVEVPNRHVRLDQVWEVSEEEHPPLTRTVAGVESFNGEQCVKLVGLQQSEEWTRPRADRSAWQRRELVWMSPRLGMASRVERVIEQREPAHEEPSQRVVARYELESSLVYPEQLFMDRLREIRHAQNFQESAELLIREAGKHGPRPFAAHLAKIDYYLDYYPPTPYREALVQLKRRLEATRDGQTPSTDVADINPVAAPISLGQLAPDFVVPILSNPRGESLRLRRMVGKPVLLFFYNPASKNAEELLRFAQSMQETHQGRITVLGLAFSDDGNAILKQYAELQLGFPLLAGKGLRHSYAVDATPKLVVIDAAGIVRSIHVGWGWEIPAAVAEELKRFSEPEASAKDKVTR